MRKYKVVQVTSAEAFETSLNELAQAGWKVVSSNMAFSGAVEPTAVYYALLKSTPIEDELKQLMEKNDESIEDVNLSPSSN
ncbi:hypothetical protein [Pontibacter harenae]|uniref:hypothetical protein n=1 Tax=Pontibacter harenae TaxID=2894083 RepID=UPI001E3BC8E8|nr:hypothetical protein [Pontibacter harenae]MCC9165845.1 hypothetical protein [Pontibacter harenae]